jgi:ankyrin repeat protein
MNATNIDSQEEAQAMWDLLKSTPIPAIESFRNDFGSTPLHIVCSKGLLSWPKFEFFLRWGMPLDTPNFKGQTILHYLAQSGQGFGDNKNKAKIIVALRAQDLSAFVNRQDINGRTALMYAIINGDEQVFDLLMGAPNIDKSIADNNGKKAIDYINNGFKSRVAQRRAMFARMKQRVQEG